MIKRNNNSNNLGLFNFKNSSEIFVENVNKNSNASRLEFLRVILFGVKWHQINKLISLYNNDKI